MSGKKIICVCRRCGTGITMRRQRTTIQLGNYPAWEICQACAESYREWRDNPKESK